MNVIFPPEPVKQLPPPPGLFVRAARRVNFWMPSVFKQTLQCAAVALMGYCSYIVATHYVLQSVEVVGSSMVPTLRNNDRYILNRCSYLFRDPKPNDIVVIKDPSDNTYAVKRIVGQAGDAVHIKEGRVYVNGKLLDEPYLQPGTPTYAFLCKRGEEFVLCGDDRFFVLGDNRGNSMDSRVYGAIPRENILGSIVR